MKIYVSYVEGAVRALSNVGGQVIKQEEDRAEVLLTHGDNSLTLDVVKKGDSSPFDADYYDSREPGG